MSIGARGLALLAALLTFSVPLLGAAGQQQNQGDGGDQGGLFLPFPEGKKKESASGILYGTNDPLITGGKTTVDNNKGRARVRSCISPTEGKTYISSYKQPSPSSDRRPTREDKGGLSSPQINGATPETEIWRFF